MKKVGDSVTEGEAIVEADLEHIKEKGKPIITPVIITAPSKELTLEKHL